MLWRRLSLLLFGPMCQSKAFSLPQVDTEPRSGDPVVGPPRGIRPGCASVDLFLRFATEQTYGFSVNIPLMAKRPVLYRLVPQIRLARH